MFIYKNKGLLINILLICIFTGCMSEYDPIDENDELIFKKSYEITVPPYDYMTDNSDTIHVLGDSSYYMNIPDTVNPTPVLAWKSVNLQMNLTAIFSNPILVTNSSIVNTDDIVWLWHSGFHTGTNGQLDFQDGRNIRNGNIHDTIPAEPLLVDSTYYWGTWYWNNEGIQIWYSSRPQSIYIKQ